VLFSILSSEHLCSFDEKEGGEECARLQGPENSGTNNLGSGPCKPTTAPYADTTACVGQGKVGEGGVRTRA
jgi:hypothetical protein